MAPETARGAWWAPKSVASSARCSGLSLPAPAFRPGWVTARRHRPQMSRVRVARERERARPGRRHDDHGGRGGQAPRRCLRREADAGTFEHDGRHRHEGPGACAGPPVAVGLEPGRARDMCIREAMRPLTVERRAPRGEQPAAMGARGRDPVPRAVHRREVRAGRQGDVRGRRRCRRAARAFDHAGRIAATRSPRRRSRRRREHPGRRRPGPGLKPDDRERKNPGDDLFSRKAALSVSWALESLTAVFGMGTGVASPLESPGSCASDRVQSAAAPPRAVRAGGAGIFNVANVGAPMRPVYHGLLRGADPWSVAEEVKPSTISTA